MVTNGPASWQVALACGVYVVIAWVIKLYRVVPPRDWLAQRLADSELRIRSERWKVGDEGRNRLADIRKSIAQFWPPPPISQIQAGWRQVHSIEDNHVLELDHDQVDESLKTLKTQLRGITGSGSSDLATRVEGALKSGISLDSKRALLREASLFRHNVNDSAYEDLATLLGKGMWLIFVGLALVAALAIAFGHASYFMLGAAGGLTSRLTRILKKRPSASDYGAGWSSLLLSPAAGALFGWTGVLVTAALSAAPLQVLNASIADVWTNTGPLGLTLAFLFGFSERLLERVLSRAEATFGSELEDKQKTKAAE